MTAAVMAPTAAAAGTSVPTAYPVVGTVTQSPAAAYVVNGVIHRPGRTSVRLAGGLTHVTAAKPLADGRWAVVSDVGLTIHSRSGGLVRRVPGAHEVATNDAGTRIAFLTSAGTTGVVTSGGTMVRTWRSKEVWRTPIGFRGSDVFVSDRNTRKTYVWSTRTGAMTLWSGYQATTVSESQGRMVLITRRGQDAGDRTCYRMTDTSGSSPRTVWSRCGTFVPVQFSAAPGRFLIGFDGSGTLLARSGWQVAKASNGAILLRIDEKRRDPRALGVFDVQMTDGGTGVMVDLVSSREKNALVRCSLNGWCATTTRPISAPEVSEPGPTPYVLVSH
jgi:hypothetical protein